MYKGVSKEQRDKVQMMAAEKKVRLELEDSKLLVQKYQEIQKEERKKLADDEAIRKIKLLDDQVHGLQRQIAMQNSEGETLISEMEVTGQAFEDMQDQNSRLIQQLKEKDDANFKLMNDKIKSNQLQKLAREERELLKDQVCQTIIFLNIQIKLLYRHKHDFYESLAQNFDKASWSSKSSGPEAWRKRESPAKHNGTAG